MSGQGKHAQISRKLNLARNALQSESESIGICFDGVRVPEQDRAQYSYNTRGPGEGLMEQPGSTREACAGQQGLNIARNARRGESESASYF